MITVKYRGQTGNQLFQYAYARLLARITGREFHGRVEHFDELRWRSWDDPKDSNGIIHIKQNSNHEMILTFEVMENMTNGFDIDLECYFENAELFRLWRSEITNWFNPPGADVDSIGIHVRGMDAKHISPPLKYYEDALLLVYPFGPRLVVYTDDPTDDVVQALVSRYNGITARSGVRDDFEAMRRHTTLIIGNSTFAWWAAFTSDPSHTIIQPEPTSGFRSRQVPNSCLLLPYWNQIKYEP